MSEQEMPAMARRRTALELDNFVREHPEAAEFIRHAYRDGIQAERARCAEIAHAIEDNADRLRDNHSDGGADWAACAAQIHHEIDQGVYAKSEAKREREQIVAALRSGNEKLLRRCAMAIAASRGHLGFTPWPDEKRDADAVFRVLADWLESDSAEEPA